MNKKTKYGFVFLLLSIFAIVLYWANPLQNRESYEEDSVEGAKDRDSSAQEPLGGIPPVKESLSPEQLWNIEKANDISDVERMKEIVRFDYNTPIDFWGKVVDQSGNPLAGVKIDIVIDQQAGRKSHVVFSDEKGLFELLGESGARARVSVSKDGYAPTSNEEIGSRISSRTIYYSMEAMPAYAPPTRENPQVFALRKKIQ